MELLTEKEKSADINKVQKRYYALCILDMVLFTGSIIIAKNADLSHLSIIEIINIAFDWAGMFVLMVILYSCINGRKRTGSRIFICFIFLVSLCLFFEAGAGVPDRIGRMRRWNYVCSIGCNSMLPVCSFCFLEFVYKTLDISKKDTAFSYLSSLAMMCAGIPVEILNIRSGNFWGIRASGMYAGNDWGSLIGYIPFLYILGNCALIILGHQMKWPEKLSYLSYIIIPLLTSIWYGLTGYPPSPYLAFCISLLIIYGNIYINMGKELERTVLENTRKDIEIIRQGNQLTLSQIRPHFIFNCLGSIGELCRLEPEKARAAIIHFSKYLRTNMDSISEGHLILFSRELEHIHNYVWLEKMRFGEELEYREVVEAVDFLLPPLSIQPLVENAIKHGMPGKEEETLTVILSVKEDATEYEVQIRDNGAGFDPKQKNEDGRSHIGIRNVRESLQMKVRGTLEIKPETGAGTTVTVHIPKEGQQ